MESFWAGLALNGSALGIAPIAAKLLRMDQILQSFAYVYPFFAFDAKLGHLVHLDAILMKHEWKADYFSLLCIFIFAEGTNERLVCFLTECTDLHGFTRLRSLIFHQDVIFIGLCSRLIWLSHSFLDLFGWVLMVHHIIKVVRRHFLTITQEVATFSNDLIMCLLLQVTSCYSSFVFFMVIHPTVRWVNYSSGVSSISTSVGDDNVRRWGIISVGSAPRGDRCLSCICLV